ncbi:MAG: hypothetical protein LBE38_03675 [Deltaproteobacteria bacterium]|jgi:hypothetical protein|nr:hypothetical protein [Deltaproteobacteria bacterium]
MANDDGKDREPVLVRDEGDESDGQGTPLEGSDNDEKWYDEEDLDSRPEYSSVKKSAPAVKFISLILLLALVGVVIYLYSKSLEPPKEQAPAALILDTSPPAEHQLAANNPEANTEEGQGTLEGEGAEASLPEGATQATGSLRDEGFFPPNEDDPGSLSPAALSDDGQDPLGMNETGQEPEALAFSNDGQSLEGLLGEGTFDGPIAATSSYQSSETHEENILPTVAADTVPPPPVVLEQTLASPLTQPDGQAPSVTSGENLATETGDSQTSLPAALTTGQEAPYEASLPAAAPLEQPESIAPVSQVADDTQEAAPSEPPSPAEQIESPTPAAESRATLQAAAPAQQTATPQTATPAQQTATPQAAAQAATTPQTATPAEPAATPQAAQLESTTQPAATPQAATPAAQLESTTPAVASAPQGTEANAAANSVSGAVAPKVPPVVLYLAYAGTREEAEKYLPIIRPFIEGKHIYVSDANIDGKTIYRVTVALFANKDEALAEGKLIRDGANAANPGLNLPEPWCENASTEIVVQYGPK